MGRTLGKESNHSFEDYFKRATSPMLTLFLLNEKPMYVYKLSQELEKRIPQPDGGAETISSSGAGLCCRVFSRDY